MHNRKNQIILWLILSFALCVLWILIKPQELVGDSSDYWMLSDQFFVGGQFSFAHYSDTLRGYLFPFILLIQKGGGLFSNSLSIYIWSIFSGIIWSALIVFLLPEISKNLFKKNLNVAKILILSVLILIFFNGLFRYPLSDIYSAVFLLLSVNCLYKLNSVSNNNKFKIIVLSFAVGATAYAAYNIRTMYMFYIVGAIVFYFIKWIKIDIRKCVGGLLGISLGMLIASIPQMMANNSNLQSMSPLVPALWNGEKLTSKQLSWGIQYGRYETYIGDSEEYGRAGVYFTDKIGTTILEKEGITNLTIKDTLRLYLKYPFDFIGLYTRHVINAMDNRFPELYITDLYSSRIGIIMLNYMLWFLFFVSIFFKGKGSGAGTDRNKFISIEYIFLILISPLVSIAGAVETRFFVVIYLLMYTYVLAEFNITRYKKIFLKYKWPLSLMFLIGFALYVAITGATLSTAQDGLPVLFNNK